MQSRALSLQSPTLIEKEEQRIQQWRIADTQLDITITTAAAAPPPSPGAELLLREDTHW